MKAHQQVEVAVRLCLIARHRTEDRERLHAEGLHLRPVRYQQADDVFASHVFTLPKLA
jgi:hypothetical protein